MPEHCNLYGSQDCDVPTTEEKVQQLEIQIAQLTDWKGVGTTV